MIRRLAALGLVLSSFAAAAAPGDLDATYGTGGVVPFVVRPGDDALGYVEVQADGRIVSAGLTYTGIALTRHLPGGALDTSFGGDGRVTLKPHAAITIWRVTAVRVQPPGDKLVVATTCAGPPSGTLQACLLRVLADGTLDTTFGSGGWSFVIPPSTPAFFGDAGFIGALLPRPDGRILLPGRAGTTLFATQLTADGFTDASFGNGGTAFLALNNNPANGVLQSNAALQPDGKLVLSGYYGTNEAYVARLLANGSPDPGFGLAGAGVRTIGAPVSRALALQPDGRIVVAGCQRVARLDATGEPDPSFGTAGIATTPFATCPFHIAVQADGRIAMSGLSTDSQGARSAEFMRVDASGAIDASFGTAGRALIPIRGSLHEEYPRHGFFIQADGGLLAGVQVERDFGLVRALANGTADGSFGTAGVVATDLLSSRGGTIDAARRMADGRIVALVSNHLVRLMPDGSADPAFTWRGSPPELLQVEVTVTSLALQPDGKILLAGIVSGQGRVWRYNADGSLDSGFGSGGSVSVAFAGQGAARPNAIEVRADGSIALAGMVYGSSQKGWMARLTAAGALDTNFGSGGLQLIEVALGENALGALLIQADGKWLGAGQGTAAAGTHAIAARILADGGYDSAFGVNGRRLGPSLGRELERARVLQRADGSSVLFFLGSLFHGDYFNPAYCFTGFHVAYTKWLVLVALDAQGAIDPTFGMDGQVVTQLNALDTVATGAALDSAGRVVVTGARRLGSSGCTFSGFVARFTRNGAFDTSFGTGGVRDLPGSPGTGELVVLPDDSILVVGTTTSVDEPFATYKLAGGGPASAPAPAGDADNDGIPNSAESGAGRNPLLKDNDVFTVARLFAMQQYRDFLGREGDTAGVDHWTGQLSSGAQTRAQMAETFFASAEFQGTGSPVARLYFAYFLRIPDYDGLNHWIGQLRAGSSLETISNAFAASPEFVNTYGSLTNSQFVSLVYQNVLGRAPDAPGLAHWTAQLNGGMTRGQMMVAFSESAEYRALIANEVYVTMMYVGMLRRAPDAGGFSHWVGYMDAGNSGLALTGAFVAAPEYRGRFLP